MTSNLPFQKFVFASIFVFFACCGPAIAAEQDDLKSEIRKIADANFDGQPEQYKAFAEKQGNALIEKTDQLLALDDVTPENKLYAAFVKYWGLGCRYGTDEKTFAEKQEQFVDSLENVPELAALYEGTKRSICRSEETPFSERKNYGDPKIHEAFKAWVEKYLPFFEKYYSEKDDPQFIGITICTADNLDPDGSAGLVLWTAEKLKPIVEKQKLSKDMMTKWRAEEVENSVRRVQMLGKEMVLEGVNLDGNVVDIKDLRGKVVLIQFTTTDQPSRLPDLIKLHNSLKDHGFVFLDYNHRDDRKNARKKAEELGLPWTILCEQAAYEQKLVNYKQFYACRSNAFLVDRDGKVVGIWANGICPGLWKELEKQFPQQSQQIAELAAEQQENERKLYAETQAKMEALGFRNEEPEETQTLRDLLAQYKTMSSANRIQQDQQLLDLVELILSIPELSPARRNKLRIDRANLLETIASAAARKNPKTNPVVFFAEMEKCVDELLADPEINEVFNHNLSYKRTGILHRLRTYLLHVMSENNQTEKAAVAKEIQDRYVKILEKETQHTNAYGGGNLSSFSRFYINDLEDSDENVNEILKPFLEAVIPLFANSKDPELHDYAEKLRGIQRRLFSMGKELEFECVLMNGETFNVEDLRGKVVLVNIWATWCGPCLHEFPNMQKQYEKYKDRGYEMIAYSVDAEPDDIVKFQEEKKYPWLVGSRKLSVEKGMKDYYNFYGGSGVPTTFLLDRNGKVILRLLGTNDELLNETLEKTFAEDEGAFSNSSRARSVLTQ